MANYYNICSNIIVIAMCNVTTELHSTLNILLQKLVSDTMFSWKIIFYCSVLKSVACLALVHKAADERRITIFLSYPSVLENK
jgi:hypothetical protein